MAAKLVNNVKIAILNTGTGALQLGSAIEGYRGVEALTNGEVYSYSIRQNAAFEYGRGTYLASGQQLLRQPGFSSDGGPAINLQPGAQVSFVALAEDITSPPSLYPLSGEGPPPNEIGDVGQFYRDIASDAQLEYGPKTDTGWGLPHPLAGRPGGSNATYASLADLSGQTVPDGTDLIWIADQAESYIRDAAVNSDYLAANPETSGLDAAGQGFRRADPLREALASNLGAGLVKFSPASNYADDTIGGKAALIADLRDQAGADDGARIGAWVTDLTLGGRVKLPLGNVTLAAGQVISGNSFHLDGAGANATVINYNGSGAALKYLKPGAGGGFFGGINNVGFYSTTTTAKTAIEAENAAGLEIHHIVISTGNWLGSSAIGIKASGREFVKLYANTIACARPLVVARNAEHPTLSADHFDIANEQYIGTDATRPVIEFEEGTVLSNTTIRETAIVGGKDGVLGTNTTEAAASIHLRLSNVRREQSLDPTGYSFRLNYAGPSLEQLTIDNSRTDETQNGLYSRGVGRMLLSAAALPQGAGKTAIDDILPAGGSRTLIECKGQVGGTKTIVNGWKVLGTKSYAAGDPIGPFEHWQYFVTPSDSGINGSAIDYSALPLLQIGTASVGVFDASFPAGTRVVRLPLGPRTFAVDIIARSADDRFEATIRSDGTVMQRSATGVFASQATSGKIYLPDAGGFVGDTLAAPTIIRVEVRQ